MVQRLFTSCSHERKLFNWLSSRPLSHLGTRGRWGTFRLCSPSDSSSSLPTVLWLLNTISSIFLCSCSILSHSWSPGGALVGTCFCLLRQSSSTVVVPDCNTKGSVGGRVREIHHRAAQGVPPPLLPALPFSSKPPSENQELLMPAGSVQL